MKYQTMQRMMGSPQQRVRIRIVKCPVGCGWYRPYRDDPTWMHRMLMHPEYGNVSNIDLARLDIANHDCTLHKEALRKVRKLFGPRRSYDNEEGNNGSKNHN